MMTLDVITDPQHETEILTIPGGPGGRWSDTHQPTVPLTAVPLTADPLAADEDLDEDEAYFLGDEDDDDDDDDIDYDEDDFDEFDDEDDEDVDTDDEVDDDDL